MSGEPKGKLVLAHIVEAPDPFDYARTGVCWACYWESSHVFSPLLPDERHDCRGKRHHLR